MPTSLILSSNTLNQGRIIINDFMSGTSSIFSASTNFSVFSLNSSNDVSSGYRSFVFGFGNSASTTNYTTINGGTYNVSQPAFSFIGNGNTNTITNTISSYSSILNGKTNSISPSTAGEIHNFILGGLSNSITKGKYNSTFNGKNNVISRGNYNIINGYSNKIYGTNAGGIVASTVLGFSNILSGSNTTTFNFVHGYSHQIKDYGLGLTNYVTLFGKSNKVISTTGPVGGSHSFMAGTFLTNVTSGAAAKSNVVMFGRGTSLVSPLRPQNNYEMILGSSATRRARIRFDASPNAYLSAGSWQNSGADYGEYFEWLDQNSTKENRTGFFVEIVDGKIQIAKSKNVIGVISKNTSFVGDSVQDYWNETYQKNEWGEILKEKFEEYEFEVDSIKKNIYFNSKNIAYSEYPNIENPKGIITNGFIKENGKFLRSLDIEKFNEKYDPKINYIPRVSRSEWDVVGLLGKLRIRTSEQITSKFIDVDINTGMAKNGTTYPVLQKIKDFDGNYGIVLIYFK